MTIIKIIMTTINFLMAFFSFATANPERLSRTTCVGCVVIGIIFCFNTWFVWA